MTRTTYGPAATPGQFELTITHDHVRSYRTPIVALHGRGANALQFAPIASPFSGWPLLETLAARGYPTKAIDAGSPTSWGNDASLAAVLDTVNQCIDIWDAEDGVVLFGYSMGAVIALNHALREPGTVRGIILVNPAVSLLEMHTLHAAEVDAAYGGSYAGHDPMTFADQLLHPLYVFQGQQDTVVDPATTDAFFDLYGGDDKFLVEMNGDHVSWANIDRLSVIEFIESLV